MCHHIHCSESKHACTAQIFSSQKATCWNKNLRFTPLTHLSFCITLWFLTKATCYLSSFHSGRKTNQHMFPKWFSHEKGRVRINPCSRALTLSDIIPTPYGSDGSVDGVMHIHRMSWATSPQVSPAAREPLGSGATRATPIELVDEVVGPSFLWLRRHLMNDTHASFPSILLLERRKRTPDDEAVGGAYNNSDRDIVNYQQ